MGEDRLVRFNVGESGWDTKALAGLVLIRGRIFPQNIRIFRCRCAKYLNVSFHIFPLT